MQVAVASIDHYCERIARSQPVRFGERLADEDLITALGVRELAGFEKQAIELRLRPVGNRQSEPGNGIGLQCQPDIEWRYDPGYALNLCQSLHQAERRTLEVGENIREALIDVDPLLGQAQRVQSTQCHDKGGYTCSHHQCNGCTLALQGPEHAQHLRVQRAHVTSSVRMARTCAH